MYSATFRARDIQLTYLPESLSVGKWLESEASHFINQLKSGSVFLDIVVNIHDGSELDRLRQLKSCVSQILTMLQNCRRNDSELVISLTVGNGRYKRSILKTVSDNMSWLEMPNLYQFLEEEI